MGYGYRAGVRNLEAQLHPEASFYLVDILVGEGISLLPSVDREIRNRRNKLTRELRTAPSFMLAELL